MKRIIPVALTLAMALNLMPIATRAASNNQITNSAFNDLSSWQGVGSGSISLDTTQNGSGGKGSCLKATMEAGEYYDIRTRAVLEPGVTYTVSFYAKASDGGISVQPIRLYDATSGWNYLQTATLSTLWERYSFDWTAPLADTKGKTVDAYGSIEWRILNKGTIWLDDISIVDASIIDEGETEGVIHDYYQPYEYTTPDKAQALIGFSDTTQHWANEALAMLRTDGLINGVGNDCYEPDRSITRAEFLTLLMNQFNLEANPYKQVYNDVVNGEWYTPIIQNAYDLGIINPILTTDGNFYPEAPITRQDAAVLAESYMSYKGMGYTREQLSFSDEATISDYALPSVHGAYRRGVINGYEDNSFMPLGTLTRAESAQILLNILECSGRMSIYVDPDNGTDSASGTKLAPVKTIKQAQSIARALNQNMTHNLYIFIKAGEHFIEEPVSLDVSDSGSNGCSIIYTSYGEGQAILSGGRHITTNWQVDNAQLGIYKTFVGTDIKTRQLFVNGIRMVRARSESGFKSPKSRINDDETGYVTEDTQFLGYRNIADMELVYYVEWTNPRCGVDKLEKNGDGTITLKMENPCWTYLMGKAHLKPANPRYFENQYEFLDAEGEWYLDKDGWLFYKPFSFIDLSTADVVLPTTESLLTVTGSKTARVQNVAFINLGFEYATWLRPSTGYGYTDAQGGRIREGQDKVPDASVWIKYTKNVSVTDCTFTKLGLSALNVTDWVEDVRIAGNHIYDISGCGMYVGNHGTEGGASGEGQLSQNVVITNNLVHDYGVDYGSSDGIEGMTMSNATVSHNEVYNGRYSGLVLGYGAAGGRYAVDYVYNYVHDVMNENIYDGGSIYVTQETGGSTERYNQMAYNYCAQQGNLTGVLYPDNNSTFWEVHHNVVDQTRKPYWYRDGDVSGRKAVWMHTNGRSDNLLHSNYTTNENYTISDRFKVGDIPVMTVGENYCYPNADWPTEALDIINNAGLEPYYNDKYPSVIQVVDLKQKQLSLKLGDEINASSLLSAYGRKDEVLDASVLATSCSTESEGIVEISKDGTIKSIGTGIADVIINIVNGDILYTKQISIYSGDKVSAIDFGTNGIALYVGTSTKLSGTAKSVLGGEFELEGVTYSSNNSSVATVDAEGNVVAIGEGNTTITINALCKGEALSVELPVTVRAKNFSEVFNLNNYITASLDSLVTDNEQWKVGSAVDSFNVTDSGVEFKTPSNTVGSAYKYLDELLHTRIKINAEGGWPSIALRADNNVNAYHQNTEYMISFEPTTLALQRFVDGERGAFEPLRIPYEFEYGKEYDLYIGAINHDDNVEIIVVIDGEVYLQYHDYDKDRITNSGYLQIYCRAGSLELLKTK